MNSWLSDLRAIASEYDALDEASVQRNLTSIAILLDAMSVNQPNETKHQVQTKVYEIQTIKVVHDMIDTLQNILGYYYLPEQTPGQNEPIIGSAVAVQLQRQLKVQQHDLFEIKNQMIELMNTEERNS